ncbi:MAG: DUF493 domain-containing protein [Puniceicoccaceae bacterium]|nr:DUF493 domain-containing protein [Puniceicoccaceae bacterium]|tara:strand:- start:1836 stop:2108 length:273 start_codon:yes stop_codon:yes gene_type:complete
MSSKDDNDYESLKQRLDSHYTWPCAYLFKFIVPREQSNQVIELLDDTKLKEKYSAKGRFVSFSCEKLVQSSDEVIALYRLMEKIPGIITL